MFIYQLFIHFTKRLHLKYLFILFSTFLLAQKKETIFTLDYNIGKTMPANEYFHKMDPFQAFSVGVGFRQNDTMKKWVNFLKNPITGVMFQYNNYGNKDKVGESYAILPYIELPLNKKQNINMQLALGISYFTVIHDTETNWYNRGVSTRYNWAFRKFIYYNFLDSKQYSHSLGIGFIHHSNGHVNWPNQGLNSFAIGYKTQFNKEKKNNFSLNKLDKNKKEYFYSLRTGLGFNALSRFHNNQEKVYTTAFSIGKILDNTYKLSVGFNYKFYNIYHNYITENKQVVATIYPELKNNPIYNSSTYGFFFNSEMMLGYVSGELELGVNIDKPFYKVDFRINESKYNGNEFVLGELNNSYKLKRLIYTRLGLKVYVINNNLKPKNNFYIGGFLNANLGQADFSEISLGYVRRLN